MLEDNIVELIDALIAYIIKAIRLNNTITTCAIVIDNYIEDAKIATISIVDFE